MLIAILNSRIDGFFLIQRRVLFSFFTVIFIYDFYTSNSFKIDQIDIF